jgi:hypothetical protein
MFPICMAEQCAAVVWERVNQQKVDGISRVNFVRFTLVLLGHLKHIRTIK